jgi:hypothetical protein
MMERHNCQFTPPEKAARIKKQMELFMEKVEDIGGAKACNFCSAKEENVKNRMISCSSCKTRFYCSKRCQKWDWTVANHKLEYTKQSAS